MDAAGQPVASVRYATEGDWALRQRGPTILNHRGWKWLAPADGLGMSLQLRNPDQDSGQGRTGWQPRQHRERRT